MIITIASQKGGCSKTTLSINISAELASLKYRVLLIDLDVQHSSFDWVNRRTKNYPNLPKIDCLRAINKEAIQSYDYIIIDSPINKEVVNIADLVITPFKPSLLDISTLPIVNKLTENKPVLAVVTQCPTNSTTDVEGARELLSSFSNIKLSKINIYTRKAYTDSIIGVGVTEQSKDLKSKNEITILTNEIRQWQKQI